MECLRIPIVCLGKAIQVCARRNWRVLATGTGWRNNSYLACWAVVIGCQVSTDIELREEMGVPLLEASVIAGLRGKLVEEVERAATDAYY